MLTWKHINFIFGILAVFLVTDNSVDALSILQFQEVLRGDQIANCVCMNWRACQGKINSDVPCAESYIQVCCTQPDPEAIPPYSHDENINDIDNGVGGERTSEDGIE